MLWTILNLEEKWFNIFGGNLLLVRDEIMTTALLDRLLLHAHIFSLNGESYRISSKKKME